MLTILRFVIVTILARTLLASELAKPEEEVSGQATSSASKEGASKEISEDFKAKYEALRKAEEEAHLAAEYAKVKETETEAMVQETEAKVEEAKDDIKIEKAEMADNEKEVVAATANKEDAKEVKEMDKAVIQEAVQEEKAIETKEIKVEQQSNQTLQDSTAGEAASKKASEGEVALNETLTPKKETFGWSSTIVIVMLVGCMCTISSNIYKRQQLLDSDYPMMAGFHRHDEEIGQAMRGAAGHLSQGFRQQLSTASTLSGYTAYH